MEYLKSGLAESMAIIPITLLVSAMILRQIPKIKPWHIIVVLWFFGILAGFVFEDKTEFMSAIVRGFIQGTLATGLAMVYARFVQSENLPLPPSGQ